MAKPKYIGEVYQTNNYGKIEVLEYINSGYVKVKFLNTGNERYTSMSVIRSGSLKDKEAVSVYGVGIIGDVVHSENGVVDKAFSAWRHMLARCYCSSTKKRQPTYEGCHVSEDFKHYIKFKQWFDTQTGCDDEDYQLDKDLLVNGNQLYSEATCCLLPRKLNSYLTSIPVYGCTTCISYKKLSNTYIVEVGLNREKVVLGHFKTYKEAFLCLAEHKEHELKTFAKLYEGCVSKSVYERLMSYEIPVE